MYFGAYFGAASVTVEVAAPVVSPPGTVESPYTVTDPEYFDHTARALMRLCEYAKAKVSDG